MLVGVLGFIGSGKGTVGDLLSNSYAFQQVSFAEHLKDVTATMFGWPRHLLEGDTDESRKFREEPDAFWSKKMGKTFTPRLALQLMGTEAGRKVFHENFWVLSLEKKISSNSGNFVVTDVRFKNEIDWVHQNNGILIEVRRGITPHWYNIAAKANNGDEHAELWMLERSGIHESEWRWIGHDIDHVIHNDKSLVDLFDNVKECLTKSFGSSIIKDLTEGVL
jgi:hypothetical protein